ncbi:unnamed protein product [Caenorhabditis angaria]|uniref:Uncharacterized protein n=1 Tax=Caenorhabditis angaria TaxID=860376 RepID=A0A9P1ICI7_9PELO|nr:unnamed protein product [Caenorhabditis angaria]
MKIVALLFFFAIIFALPHTPSSELHQNDLLVYWMRVEKDFDLNIVDRIQDIYIYLEYSDTFKIYKDRTKMGNASVLNAIIHEDDYRQMKFICKDSREQLTRDVKSAFRYAHITVDCESVQKKALEIARGSKCPKCPECSTCSGCSVLRYVGVIFLICLAILCLIAYIPDIITCCTNRCRRGRNPVGNGGVVNGEYSDTDENEERQPHSE